MKVKLVGVIFSISILICSCGGRPQPPTPPVGAIPTPTAQTQIDDGTISSTLPNCNVSVYIENSASMDGYVKGSTNFENAVHSYIKAIERLSFCDTIYLNYINDRILKQPYNISNYIEDVEPKDFRKKGGNQGTTDIASLFKMIMDEQGTNDISILISDFVFSPGSKNDAKAFLIKQQTKIQGHFDNKLKSDSSYAAILYRLVSDFDGYYYNRIDSPTYLRNDRPFFIWVLGNKDQLQRLTSEIRKENIKGKGVQNTFCISKMSQATPYGILPMPRVGTFQIDPVNVKTSILKAKVDRKNPNEKFMVSFGVNYNSFLLEDSYLTDPENYEINNKAYSVEIIRNPNSATSQYTHIIKLKLDASQPVISRGNIKVSLLKKSAPWADSFTDYDGMDINADGAMEKTFGLKTLIDGVYDAYKTDNNYASFTINIQ